MGGFSPKFGISGQKFSEEVLWTTQNLGGNYHPLPRGHCQTPKSVGGGYFTPQFSANSTFMASHSQGLWHFHLCPTSLAWHTCIYLCIIILCDCVVL